MVVKPDSNLHTIGGKSVVDREDASTGIQKEMERMAWTILCW